MSVAATRKLGFVPSGSGAPVGGRPAACDANPPGNSFDWATTWLSGRHPVVLTGRQLGSFRKLSSEDNARRIGAHRTNSRKAVERNRFAVRHILLYLDR